MTALYCTYASGECGRGILPPVREETASKGARLVFVDDTVPATEINGHEALTWKNFRSVQAVRRRAALVIADQRMRQRFDRKRADAGIGVIGVRATTVIEMDDVEIGLGALLSPFVRLASNLRVGPCFQAILYSHIEHGCRVGDYVNLAPGVCCATAISASVTRPTSGRVQ